MLSPWFGIVLVPLLLGGLILGMKSLAGRCALHPEISRKLVHIIMGLVTLTFPWLFVAAWPVLLLSALAIAALAAIRFLPALQERFGKVLHGVERKSLGEIYFPLAVALLFLLADGHRLFYVIPLLTLTLADAVAALVGVRYGEHRYATSEGSKSAEGSLAFFLVAFLSAYVPLLLLSESGRSEALLIALVLGILVMLFEAISVGGLDNLFIPLGCYALLRRYLPLGTDELLFRLGAICLLALLVYCWRRRTTLKESGLLAAAVVGYMNWVVGGWQWLVVSLILLLTYTRLWPGGDGHCRPVKTVRAVVAVAAPGLLWLLAAVESGDDRYLFPFILVHAVHLLVIGMIQLGCVQPGQPDEPRLWQAVFRSWLVFLPTFFLAGMATAAHSWVGTGLVAAGIALLLLVVAGSMQQRCAPRYGAEDSGYAHWLRRGALALAISAAGWGLMLPWFFGGII
jgi:phytol kinase